MLQRITFSLSLLISQHFIVTSKQTVQWQTHMSGNKQSNGENYIPLRFLVHITACDILWKNSVFAPLNGSGVGGGGKKTTHTQKNPKNCSNFACKPQASCVFFKNIARNYAQCIFGA